VACDVWVEDLDPTIEPSLLVLIAQRQAGYKALSRLLSRGYSENHHNGRMILKRSWIQADSEGLLALSAAADGDVGKAIVSGQLAEASRRAVLWQELFPEGYYLKFSGLIARMMNTILQARSSCRMSWVCLWLQPTMFVS